MAGGHGRRMGMDKGLIQFLEKPMIEHVVGAIKSLCDKIIISANSHVYDYLGFPVVKDHFIDAGPSAGILEGIKSSTNYTNIIVPCDMPLVSASFLNCLLSFSEDFDITVPEVEDIVQPLCGIYKKSTSIRLEKLLIGGERRMSSLLDSFETNYVRESDFPELNIETILQNFNSPDEIENYLNSDDG